MPPSAPPVVPGMHQTTSTMPPELPPTFHQPPPPAPEDSPPFALEEESVAVPVPQQDMSLQGVGSQGHQMARSGGGNADIVATAEAYGFTGIDLNAFGVLPTLSLKNGAFQSGDGALVLGEEFHCHVYGGRPKYVYKTDLLQNDPRYDICYTFDDEYASGSGIPIQKKLSEWKAVGIPFSKKNYVDLRIGILREAGGDPLLALLSIPPTSVSNYTNLTIQLMHWAQMTLREPGERVVRVWKGPLVTKVKFPFNPIKFDVLPV